LPLLKGTEKNYELFRVAFLGIITKPAPSSPPPPHIKEIIQRRNDGFLFFYVDKSSEGIYEAAIILGYNEYA
jgi:hypothetical protein